MRFLPAFVQVAVQVVAAVLLAVVVATLWSARYATGFAVSLSTTLYLAAALWAIGSGSVAPRATKVSYMQWAVSVSTRSLTEDVQRRRTPDVVELTSLGSGICVALVLGTLGVLAS